MIINREFQLGVLVSRAEENCTTWAAQCRTTGVGPPALTAFRFSHRRGVNRRPAGPTLASQ